MHISSDGKHLYASNRGHNSIACFSVDGDSGKLEIVLIIESKGDHPRDFNIDASGDYAIVGNQNTDNILVYVRD